MFSILAVSNITSLKHYFLYDHFETKLFHHTQNRKRQAQEKPKQDPISWMTKEHTTIPIRILWIGHSPILKWHCAMKNNQMLTQRKSNVSFWLRWYLRQSGFTVSRIQKASLREIKAQSYGKFIFKISAICMHKNS